MHLHSDTLYSVYMHSLVRVGHFELQTPTKSCTNVLTVYDPLVRTSQRILMDSPM